MGWIRGHTLCPLIQHTFGFSELNKVAFGMGIQSSTFSSANWLCKAFIGWNLWIIPDVMAYFPLTPPRFFTSHSVVFWLSTASYFEIPYSTWCIRHGSTTAWTHGDIFLVKDPDRLCLVIFLKTAQKFPAADQVPAYGNQPSFVLIAEKPIVAYPDKSSGRDVVIPHFSYIQIMLYSAELKRGTA